MLSLNDQKLLHHVSKLEKQEIEKLFKRVFLNDEGQKVIAYLKTITFERALNPKSSNEELRYAEGERSLLAKIIRLSTAEITH